MKPTVFETYKTTITYGRKKMNLEIWDTAGSEDYDRLRPSMYPGRDLVLLAFDISNNDSVENIFEKFSFGWWRWGITDRDEREDIPEQPIRISAQMPTDEVLKHLGDHGCEDITRKLNLSESSQFPISTGGFGDVYRGSLQQGAHVSIKCLRLAVQTTEASRKDLKRAAHELYVWSKCKHPNILELSGVALYRDQIAMISPWMGNGNVNQFLARHPRFDRYWLCSRIASGVAYLHSQKIAHGDIKGANILVSDDHIPKIADFGNAILSNNTLQFTTTTSGPSMSIRWAAPEILEEKSGFSYAADVYSLAMTFLEVISGLVPHNGVSDISVLRRVTEGARPARPQREIPTGDRRADALWALLTKCWAQEPEDRLAAASVKEAVKMRKICRKGPAKA
ncbi:unnamed protein product [Rhizoctonia solani]|uniref:Protein kinase domain-containing protein n=1 Tax=Rhizoctonia solani TaxID=456999 RepID=A0A8H3BS62_9AGAM|nr:unnamed protein product [Rhizoctonia solani]